MPGLSQLKKFSNDMVSLGNEVQVRASRGEKPVKVEIPDTIADVNDSEDFVLGMPVNEVEPEAAPIEEDFSDITGEKSGGDNPTSSDNSSNQNENPQTAVPDMSDLLNMGMGGGDAGDGSDDGMPDLSMFEDEPEPEPEEELEEVSIADMGLDALLAGAGFDEPEPEPEPEVSPEEEAAQTQDLLSDIGDLADISDIDIPGIEKSPTEADVQAAAERLEADEELGLGGEELPSLDDFDLPSDADIADSPSESPDIENTDNADEGEISLEPENEAAAGVEADAEPEAEPVSEAPVEEEILPELVPEPEENVTPEKAPEEDLPGLSPEPGQKEQTAAGEDKDELVIPETFDVNNLDDLNLDDIPEVEIEPKNIPLSKNSRLFPPKEDDFDDEFDISGGFDDDEETNLNAGKQDSDKKNPQDFEPVDDADEDLPEADESDLAAENKTSPADISIDDLTLDMPDFDMPEAENADGTEDAENGEPADESSPAEEIALPEEAAPADEMAAGDGENEPGSEDFPADTFNLDDMDMPSLDDSAFAGDANLTDSPEPVEDGALPEEAPPADEMAANDGENEPDSEDFPADTFNLDDMDMPSLDDSAFAGDADLTDSPEPVEEGALPEEAAPADEMAAGEGENEPGSEDFPADTFNLDDMDMPSLDDSAFAGDADLTDSPEPVEEGALPEETAPADEMAAGEGENEPGSEDFPADTFNLDDMDMPSLDDSAFAGDADLTDSPESVEEGALPEETAPADDFSPEGEISAADSVPDFTDSVSEDESSDFDTDGLDTAEELDNPDEPLEVFDTSGMDDVDFGISDTDSQLDDFSMGDDEFVIPGITDVDTSAPAQENKKKAKAASPAKAEEKKPAASELDTPDFSDAIPGEELPPNTLSDSQYKTFLKNFSEYPLNVRLAFENLVVQDEFTEDAEFEVIEKILNKAPARQVASMLEKMLDISIPVPRDFEHRSAEEYEAYKKSLSYQLRNRIIPGFIVGCALLLLGIGLFNFGKNCIYKPLKAISLYKQGYALLQADEYPQSEIKFDEAVKYRLNRKWFFNYARGYRDHKQYLRAEKMYKNILMCFRHDKEAGLEYADMELNDMVNYEKAEEIVRREVLDYHINDADGILELGDIYLEWGTEKDPEKLELAREQYASLIQLYKPNNMYMGRMMRYFIRSDKLRQVLEIRQNFDDNREKSLPAEDWTELSGYLLEKYYGPLPASQEYLRFQIDGLRRLLLNAAHSDPENPVALYNLSKYYVLSNESERIEATLKDTLKVFNMAKSLKRRDIYKYIDTYKLLGEYYESNKEHVQAQEQFAEGISLYTKERDNAGFEGNEQIGKLYEDMGNLKYFVSADYDDALKNYMSSVELNNDSPQIRYRIGFIQYNNDNLTEALGSFMKAGDGNVKERNLMLAMANTLNLRGDDYAAEGYYSQLVRHLDDEIAEKQVVFPQVNESDADIVDTYLKAANNYGVTLHRLAKRTGNSSLNAKSIVEFQQSLRAWDALTRNQNTLLRLDGTNLAEQNIKYVTHNFSDYEPAIYTQIPKTLTDKEY